VASHQPEGFMDLPAAGDGPGVVVLHPWWGLNDTIKAVCTRLAEEGFAAFAPDLYHGQIASSIQQAEALSSELLAGTQAKADVAAAITYMSEHSSSPESLAVVGFSLGAYYAIDASVNSAEHIRRVVLFYGTGEGDFTRSRSAYLGHFAENDNYESEEYIQAMEQAIRAAGRPVEFHRYPGTGHWFFEEDVKQAFKAEAATLAWKRTLKFLRQPMGEPVTRRSR
jgi:carboxymethylenebutenolidase